MTEVTRGDTTLVLNDIEHTLRHIEDLLKKIEGHLAYIVVDKMAIATYQTERPDD